MVPAGTAIHLFKNPAAGLLIALVVLLVPIPVLPPRLWNVDSGLWTVVSRLRHGLSRVKSRVENLKSPATIDLSRCHGSRTPRGCVSFSLNRNLNRGRNYKLFCALMANSAF